MYMYRNKKKGVTQNPQKNCEHGPAKLVGKAYSIILEITAELLKYFKSRFYGRSSQKNQNTKNYYYGVIHTCKISTICSTFNKVKEC